MPFSYLFFISLLINVRVSLSAQADDSASLDENSCSDRQKCKQANTVCRDGMCQCKDLFQQDTSGKCLKSPTVGEKCSLPDGSILDCKGPGVDASCPDENVCKCLAGYEKVGKSCKYKDKKLGDSCDSDTDCGIAFANCKNNKCTCMTGFRVESGLCTSEKKCPGNAQPIKGVGNKPKVCEVKKQQIKDDDSSNQDDDCGPTGFCFYHPLIKSKAGYFSGHCCTMKEVQRGQKLSLACPAGEPIPVDSCGSDQQDSDDSSSQPAKMSDSPAASSSSGCPASTHTCIYASNASFCCPVPCPGSFSFFAQNGRCLEMLALGQPCASSGQCGRGAHCPEGSQGSSPVCTCKSDHDLVDGSCEKKASP